MLSGLKRYRAENGLSQQDLGKELGVHPITVSRWEVGTRKIDGRLVPKISQVTGIPVRELRPDLFGEPV